MILTEHAKIRAQQRNISEDAIEFAQEFGEMVRQCGCFVYFLGKRAVNRAHQRGLNLREWENTVVVLSDDGVVVTTYKQSGLKLGKLSKRFKRHESRTGHSVSE